MSDDSIYTFFLLKSQNELQDLFNFEVMCNDYISIFLYLIVHNADGGYPNKFKKKKIVRRIIVTIVERYLSLILR